MGKWKGLVTLFFVLGVVFVSGLLGASLVLNNVVVEDGIRYLLNGEPEFSGGEIVFTRKQLKRVNRVFRDVETEYGWCLRVDGGRVSEVDHFRSLNYTTKRSIRFGCSETVHNGRMHSHVLGFGSVRLSRQDRETLRSLPGFGVSCVVADPVEMSVERNPPGLACYSVGESGEIQRLKVVVRSAG